MKTEEVLQKMLTENTGRHFLDSGGEYGRAWQRNQGKDFKAEPESKLEFSTWEDSNGKTRLSIEVTHSVYHWLNEQLEYDEAMDKRFHRWARHPSREDEHWLGLMEEWAEKMMEKHEEVDKPNCVNTYNGEDLLSQTLQYVRFRVGGEDYVLLQIHGGADVRGGYTKPRVFREMEEYAIYNNARAAIYCNGPDGHNWTTDDGHHWYEDGSCGAAYKQLETYDVVEFEPGSVICRKNLEPHEKHTHGDDPLCSFAEDVTVEKVLLMYDFKDEEVLVLEGKKGYCPLCGGELKAGFY